MSAILAWTWIPADRRLPHGDGRPIVEGETLSVALPLMLCEHGLHASESVLDALQYATSGLVARVECSGEIARGKNKLCCEHRKALWVFDATRVLHLFACDVAEQALRKAGVTEARCWNAIRAKRAWVVGVATDEELDAAWDAARDVARNAASAAAWAAANAAANAVAWDAAWEAAWAAATVKRPTPCCPQCIKGAVLPATEVLLTFLDHDQHESWAKERTLVVEGGSTGNHYLLAHRHSPAARRIGRICYDLDDHCVVHFHDLTVPPEEEVLAAKLILEHKEPWLRNEATMLGIAAFRATVYKNPFGDDMDGAYDSRFMSNIGRAFGLR